MKVKIVATLDNAYLALIAGNGVGIGCGDSANGIGAEEMAVFAATRDEVRQLYKYWAQQAIEIALDWFLYQQIGGSESRLRSYAGHRLGCIEETLGPEECDALWTATEAEMAARCGDLWRMFKEDDQVARDRRLDEIFSPVADGGETESRPDEAP